MKKLLLPVLGLLLYTFSQAQSYSGGEIQIENLGDDIFKTTAYYVKNCFYCSGDKTCDVPDNLTITYGANSELSVVLKIVDTQTSAISKCTDCNRCTDDSCAYPYGYTTFKLEGIFSLETPIANGNCEYTAVLDVGPLDSSIAPIAPSSKSVTLTNTFNACVINSTPKSTFFGELICLGRDLIKSTAASPVDKNNLDKYIDEIVYSVVPVKTGDVDAIYNSVYSYDAPLYYLGFPKKDLKFPRGFHFDSSNADLLFRPMKKQNVLIRIKMEEYRDNKLLSTSYKDIYYQITACPSNNAPVISAINCKGVQPENYKTSVVVGETLCFNICTSDKDKSDTISLDWNNGIPDATFSILDSNVQRQTGRFCWTPTDDDISKFPHIFVASAKDNGCPTGAFTARSFAITVKDRPRFKTKIETDNCGRGFLVVEDTGSIEIAQWYFGLNGRAQVKNGSRVDTFYFSNLTSGYHNYTLTAMGTNGSSYVLNDSLLSNGMPPFNKESVTYDICENDTAFFGVESYLQNGTTIKWLGDNSTRLDTFFNPSTDKKHQIVGNVGNCIDTLDVNVNVLTFTERVFSENSSGDAPHRVMFNLVDISDANMMHVDYGDENSKTHYFVADTFTFFHTYNSKGLYDLEYTLMRNGESCSKTPTTLDGFANIFSTGMSERSTAYLDVFPNPSHGHFAINTEKEVEEIKAFSIEGKEVSIIKISDNEFAVDKAAKGLYILEVVFSNYNSVKQILVIE